MTSCGKLNPSTHESYGRVEGEQRPQVLHMHVQPLSSSFREDLANPRQPVQQSHKHRRTIEVGAEPDQPAHLGGMASSLRLLWPKSEGFGCSMCHQVRTFTEVPKKCRVAHRHSNTLRGCQESPAFLSHALLLSCFDLSHRPSPSPGTA